MSRVVATRSAEATEAFPAGIVSEYAEGSLPCDGSQTDLWAVDVTAGANVQITIDTINADTAFDTLFEIYSPDGSAEGGVATRRPLSVVVSPRLPARFRGPPRQRSC